jgi:single-strand DNA-binding protein
MSTLRNKVTLIGRVGNQPEIKNLDNNRKLAKLSLATTESYKNSDGKWVDSTTWHTIIAWGNTAAYLEKNVQKGQEIMLEGRLVTRSYESGGLKKYATDVEAHEVIVIGNKTKEIV